MDTQIEEKTYKERNIKFLYSLTFLSIFSVSILLYLLSLGNFLPTDIQGNYNWLNIGVFATLLFICISSFISLLMYFVLLVFLKKDTVEQLQIYVVKMGIFSTFGIYLVIFLHFFHILNIYWGIGILVILLLLSFVI